MFSSKSFLKIIIVAFVVYALISNKSKYVNLSEKENPKYEFLNDIRSSVEVLTAEPKNKNLTNKKGPILPVNYEDNQSSDSIAQNNTQNLKEDAKNNLPINQQDKNNNTLNQPPKLQGDSNEQIQKTWLEHKILNVADNLLHSPQGQELLEKFLLNRDQVPDHLNTSSKQKDPHRNNSTIELVQGSGAPVQCGDVVSAHYITRLVNGQEIENTHLSDKPLIFQVGNRKVIKGLEYAVLGMREGGRRRLVVPPKMAYNKSKFSKGIIAGNEFVTIDVELLKIDPVYQNLDSKIRIFDNFDNAYDDYSFAIMCSDPVFFNYTITTLDSKLIAKSETSVSFILGSDSVPPAINKAFSNIKLKSKRSVILPSSLIYNKKTSFLPANAKLPSNELILIEIDTN